MTLGALNLLSVTRAPMAEADVIVARALADLAVLSIVQHRASAEAQRLNEQLSVALTSRVVIEQAKGVICERAGTDLAQAFSRLRAYARDHNLRLTDVARAAIDGALDPAAWAPPACPVRSRAEGIPVLPGPGMRPTRDPPASSAAGSPEMTLRLAGDHDRIAGRLSEIVARRLFSAGLALEAALGLIGEHRAAGGIQYAVSELDLAIRDIRDMVFDSGRPDWPVVGRSG